MNVILGNGLLGSELYRQTGWRMISRKDGFDITKYTTLDEIGLPGTVINCVAFTDTYSRLRDEHWKVNYLGVRYLIDYCNENELKLVHISTGYIYSGSVSEAKETDVPVHNNCWYSYTKLLADGLVQLESENYLLIRCIHKPRPFPFKQAWIDQVGNFGYVDEIASLIVRLIKADATGVYNVGTYLKTIHDMVEVPGIMKPKNAPSDVSMNIDKMKKKIYD